MYGEKIPIQATEDVRKVLVARLEEAEELARRIAQRSRHSEDSSIEA